MVPEATLSAHDSISRSGIAAAGNWIVDRVKVVDHWPQQDTLANILEETVGNGGGAFNVLADLSRLGAPFPLTGFGLIGNDGDGDWIIEQCRKLGIDEGQIGRIDAPTSYTDVVTVADTGRRTFFHQRGANARFGPESVRLGALDSRIFYLGYALLLDEMDAQDAEFGTRGARILSQARAEGMKTALDVVSEDSDRFSTIVMAALPHLDWLFMNEFEAGRTVRAALRNGDRLDREGMVRAARRLLNSGVREAVILHAPEGALACSNAGETIWQPSVALPTAEISGAVGAGDAFAAGVLFGLHEEKLLREALRIGACAAAASLRHASASEGVVSLDQCEALAVQFGFSS